MGKTVRGLFWILTGWFFAYDIYLWGGLAITPTIGQQLRERASVQSPIAATYLFVGRKAVDAAGLSDRAVRYAASEFPKEIADTQSPPQLIVARFLSAQSASGRLAYYGAPILLVLSMLLHVRRQKPIRSFGTKG
jgi:hypothetical protein